MRLDPTFVLTEIELLRRSHPEIWDDDEALRADMLEGSTDLHEFLAVIVDHMRDAEARAVGTEKRMSDLLARRNRYDQRVDAMRSLAFKLMARADVRKVELTEATLSIRAGQPRVIITDETALPPDCVRIKREPDKVAIREHLARGEPVAGAELSNSEPVLAVRVK